MDVAAWRRETRARLIGDRERMRAEQHKSASLAIEASLEEILRDLPPQTLSAYWPFKGEVDLRPLMEHLQGKGWITALPSVMGRGLPLEFLRWTPDAVMNPAVHGIPIPQTRIVVRPDIIILPLVGFDAANYRLGYGAGYFDITLGLLQPRPRSIGVGFELSRLETIYPMPTDIPLDLVVTEAGIHGDIR
jgi:5-formyltetrahydrofolate cyclo-ligase